MKVECEVEYVDLTNDAGRTVDGVSVTCSRCNHCVESFGTSDASVRRCFVLLREQCPEEEENYYVPDDASCDV